MNFSVYHSFSHSTSFFFKFIYFIYLFLAALGLRCGEWASHCGGFSCCRARALGTWASVVVSCRLSSCGLLALEHRVSNCGTRAQLLRGMWDLPGPGIEPVSPAMAGGFSTTAPPGKPAFHFFTDLFFFYLKYILQQCFQ